MSSSMKKFIFAMILGYTLCMGCKMFTHAAVNVEEKYEQANQMHDELVNDTTLREERYDDTGIGYFFDENGKIRIIAVPANTTYHIDGEYVTDCDATYYYDEDEHLFLASIAEGEDHYKFYLSPTEESNCAIYRYVYSESESYDYPDAVAASDYEQVHPLAIYCYFGSREMTLAQESRYEEPEPDSGDDYNPTEYERLCDMAYSVDEDKFNPNLNPEEYFNETDEFLNEVYQAIKGHLSDSEYKKLKKDELAWLDKREEISNNAEDYWKARAWETVSRIYSLLGQYEEYFYN